MGKEEEKRRSPEKNAMENMYPIELILRMSRIVGSGAYLNPERCSDELLMKARGVFLEEVDDRKNYKKTKYCRDRIDNLRGQYERARDILTRNNLSDEDLQETQDEYRSLEYALNPAKAARCLYAEVGARGQIQGLHDVNIFLSETTSPADTQNLNGDVIFTDNDYRILLELTRPQ